MKPDYEHHYESITDVSFKDCSIAMLGDIYTGPSVTGANYAVSFSGSIPPIRYNVVKLRAIVVQPSTKITPIKVSTDSFTGADGYSHHRLIRI